MQILVTRKRISGVRPLFEYRVLVPFDQISLERQHLIHYRSNFGFRGALYARLSEIIAPMAFLRMAPSLAKHEHGLDILAVARRLEATIIRALYPEMTADRVPIIFTAEADHDDRQVHTDVDDLIGSYRHYASGHSALTSDDVGLTTNVGAA